MGPKTPVGRSLERFRSDATSLFHLCFIFKATLPAGPLAVSRIYKYNLTRGGSLSYSPLPLSFHKSPRVVHQPRDRVARCKHIQQAVKLLPPVTSDSTCTVALS